MTLLLFHTKIKNCICRQQQLPTNQIIDKVHFVYAGLRRKRLIRHKKYC